MNSLERFFLSVAQAYTPPVTKREQIVHCTRDYSVAKSAEIEFPNSHIRRVHYKNGGTKYFLIQTIKP